MDEFTREFLQQLLGEKRIANRQIEQLKKQNENEIELLESFLNGASDNENQLFNSIINARSEPTCSFQVAFDSQNPKIKQDYIKQNQNQKLNKPIAVNSGIQQEVKQELPPKLKYGQGSIQKKERINKNGTVYRYWSARYMDNGVQRTITAKTCKECMEKLKEATANVVRLPKMPKLCKASLACWMEEWFNTYKRHMVKDGTVDSYLRVIAKLKTEVIGATIISRLTAQELQQFLMSIPFANTRRKTYLAINACLKKAEALDMIRKNPMINVEIPTAKSKPRRAFTFEEQQSMINALSPRYSKVFKFLCCTGLRVGEFIALNENNIDLNRKNIWITLSQSANSKNVTDPKTKSSMRAVPYLDELMNGVELGTYTYNGIKKAFNTAMKKLNIEGASIHSTRHTFSSMCYFYGIPDKQVQLWMGHSTIAMTMDTYTHIMGVGESEVGVYINKLKDRFIR